ncbi:E3 ubiquitin-protein ligase, partial [Ananas comosus]
MLPVLFLPLAQTERGEAHIITSDQGKASSYSTSLQEDNCAVVPFLSPPMPLPFDDPRFSQPQCQHDKQGEKYDDTSSYCQEVPVPLRSAVDTDPETTHTQENRNESLVKDSSVEATSEVTEIHYSSEEEDDCPICLEEYTSENPRIILQCNHHYHLSCIYEWMERSQACPICGEREKRVWSCGLVARERIPEFLKQL